MKLKVSADTGKKFSKGAILVHGLIETHRFSTIVLPDTAKSKENNGFEVVFEGKTYLIGDETRQITKNNLILSKKTEEHRLCVYTMIAELIRQHTKETTDIDIELCLTMPLTEFLKKETRLEYMNFFKKDVKITVDGRKYSFNIVKIHPSFEGAGVLLRDPNKYRNKTVVVIDVGGLNMNYCVFNNLKPSANLSGTLKHGGHVLISAIQGKLYNDFDAIFTAFEIIQIAKGEKSVPQAIKDVVANETKHHISAIYNELDLKKINLNYNDVVFTGGTSELFSPYLDEFFIHNNATVSDDPGFDNVIGSLEILRSQNG